jgi:DNA processing protein
VLEDKVAVELRDWLRLSLISGIGGETQRKLLKAFGSAEAVFAASASAWRGVIGPALAQRLQHDDVSEPIETALAWAAEPGNHIVTLGDADYPQALLDSADPPTLLYVKGCIELLNRPALAIVGSRNASRQGEANAEAFSEALAGAGLVIVSGLALGIDAAAHRGALKGCGGTVGGNKGGTIAVIGTGADRIYPARNQALTREISERGAIISEFPLGTPALASNFPRRNRIIAGLSRGCLVIEAAERSGSLITARLAADAGRDVFAIPGSIHSTLSKGCHKLIKQGAKLVESAQDVLEELHWGVCLPQTDINAVAATEDPAEAALMAALGHDPCDVDTLAARCNLTPESLLAILLQLELSGRIAALPGNRYQRLD